MTVATYFLNDATLHAPIVGGKNDYIRKVMGQQTICEKTTAYKTNVCSI